MFYVCVLLQKIYGPICCPAVQKLQIAADYAGVKTVVETPTGNTKTSIKVVTPENVEMEGSLPGIVYFARLAPKFGLLGDNSPAFEGQVLSMLYKIDHEVLIPLYAWICMAEQKEARAQDALTDVRKVLESYFNEKLLHQTYLVGERLTVADIHLACSLYTFTKEHPIGDLLTSLDNVQRWLDLVVSQDRVKKYLEKPAKKENPVQQLPPSSFVLDEWKREYSNSKDLRNVSMPWFWDRYDDQGYSLWYMRYDKTEGENIVDYATANMLSGFLQRIDNNFRKVSFAVLNVVGETGNFDILGVWLFRGLEIPDELKEHPSFQYYEFRRLDVTKSEDKELVQDYWCNDE